MTAVSNYQLLPDAVVVPVALALPWIELLAGVYLVIGLFTRLAASVVLGLLLVFVGALGSALARGLSLAGCGCFGGLGLEHVPLLTWLLGGADAGPQDLIRDAILGALAVLILRGPPTPLALDRLLFRR